MATPTTDRAYARGEDAPAELLAVAVALALELEVCTGEAGCIAVDHRGHEHGPMHRDRAACEAWIERKPAERTVTYWVGLDADMGAVNVDAAVQRAETDNPGYTAQDWGAA